MRDWSSLCGAVTSFNPEPEGGTSVEDRARQQRLEEPADRPISIVSSGRVQQAWTCVAVRAQPSGFSTKVSQPTKIGRGPHARQPLCGHGTRGWSQLERSFRPISQQYSRTWLEGRGMVKVNRFARFENTCSDRCTPVSLEFKYAGARLTIRAEPLSLRRSPLLQADVWQ